MRLLICAAWLLACMTPGSVAAANKSPTIIDPAFGETLYAFYQRQYFDAISRLLVARERGEFTQQAMDAELLLGGLYVQYDMPDAARDIFDPLLPKIGNTPQANRIWLAIAGMDYRRGRFPETLDIISTRFPRPDDGQPVAAWPPEEAAMLAAKSLMRLGRYREAIAWLGPLAGTAIESRYLAFNLAMAMIGSNDIAGGEVILQQLLTAPADDEEMRAFRDRVTMALAAARLRQDRAADALAAISLAQLDGPYSNEALLIYGVASLQAGNARWSIGALLKLSERSPHDQAVQESWVALAQAYDQASDARRAKAAYRAALAKLDAELVWLKDQDANINSGAWFKAIEKQASDIVLRDDRSGLGDKDVLAMPLHYRVYASNQFVLTFGQYVETSRLAKVAVDWQSRIPVLDYLVKNRLERHQRLSIQARNMLTELPIELRAQRQQKLADEIETLIASDAPLAVPSNQKLLDSANEVAAKMRAWPQKDWQSQREKLALMRGVLAWNLARDRPVHEWEFRRASREVGRQVTQMKELRARVAHAADAQQGNVDGWQQQLMQEDARLRELARQSVILRDGLRAQLEQEARDTVAARRQHIIELAANAAFGLGQLEHDAWRKKQQRATSARTAPVTGVTSDGAAGAEIETETAIKAEVEPDSDVNLEAPVGTPAEAMP